MLPQSDLWWMTALIFAPTGFALLIMFVPKGREEVMRWLALFGSAVALACSIVMLIGYLEQAGVVAPPSTANANFSSLEARTDAATAAAGVQTDPATGARAGM